MTIIAAYLDGIQKEYQKGNATEHSYRAALKNLIESLGDEITATNEPKHIECGAIDYIVSKNTKHGPLTIGYIEAKDIGKSLDEAEKSDQLKRYLTLPNLILTDYLEFRWYVDGKRRKVARLGEIGIGGTISTNKQGIENATAILKEFLDNALEPVADPSDLARRMARLTHQIRDIITETFGRNKGSELLKGLRRAFAVNLIPDLDTPEKTDEFADMYAQTIAYGLFAARVNHPGPEPFRRIGAAQEIPKTNPFLRKLFETVTGTDLNDEPYVGFVDDISAMLAQADMNAILEQFGRRGRLEDPVVHFYETFLAAYDPKLRKARGVYYTPEPIVSYIVRSVDYILREQFGCVNGLEDDEKIQYERVNENGKKEKAESHRVLILDPACGTGTFLYTVVDFIRDKFKRRGDAGAWSGYVKNHILPRVFGFELLMAPYAVAHFKLAMQLAAKDLDEPLRQKWAYDFEGKERLGIYLTNTLEEAEKTVRQLGLFERFIAEEANAAASIKKELPILVVMGNPPYSGHSANRSWKEENGKRVRTFIGELINDYYFVDGEPLGERNPKWLQNDYVKFIRWGQWRIEEGTKSGIMAFITSHSYLDSTTFRGMRQQLMRVFDDIYIIDLHGNAKKKERCPDGSKDGNVFDITEGVAIGIFIKRPKKRKDAMATVHHADMWGLRKRKYELLDDTDIKKTRWKELDPKSPFYFFVPQKTKSQKEYNQGWKITDLVPVNVLGFQTHRDHFAVDFDKETIKHRIAEMRNTKITDHEFSEKYKVEDNRDWKLSVARKLLREKKDWEKYFQICLYRPFDLRHSYFNEITMDYPRRELIKNVVGRENLCLLAPRQIGILGWRHVFISKNVAESCTISTKTKEGNYNFPLYLYPDPDINGDLFSNGAERHVNLNPKFIDDIEKRLKLKFVYDGKGNLKKTFGPEDVFNYIYAVFHSPAYRERYKEFLKIDFPRVPLTSDIKLFRALCSLGAELAVLHLLEASILNNRDKLITRFPQKGDNTVEKGYPKYDEKTERVYISGDNVKLDRKGQYFGKVPPEVWNFHIGGYQVCHKWLKDRQGRKLADEEISQYPKIVMALFETIRLMKKIDDAITEWPIM